AVTHSARSAAVRPTVTSEITSSASEPKQAHPKRSPRATARASRPTKRASSAIAGKYAHGDCGRTRSSVPAAISTPPAARPAAGPGAEPPSTLETAAGDQRARLVEVELAGLEPATSWVRFGGRCLRPLAIRRR